MLALLGLLRDPAVPKAPAAWEPGGGDQANQRIVRSMGNQQEELAAKGEWCHDLVKVSVG